LQLELSSLRGSLFRGVLRDDNGSICSTLEKDILKDNEQFSWTGLNDLPYGRYTVELFQGEDEMTISLVKRI
jgi:hypothetical protein